MTQTERRGVPVYQMVQEMIGEGQVVDPEVFRSFLSEKGIFLQRLDRTGKATPQDRGELARVRRAFSAGPNGLSGYCHEEADSFNSLAGMQESSAVLAAAARYSRAAAANWRAQALKMTPRNAG